MRALFLVMAGEGLWQEKKRVSERGAGHPSPLAAALSLVARVCL